VHAHGHPVYRVTVVRANRPINNTADRLSSGPSDSPKGSIGAAGQMSTMPVESNGTPS
jgi:hypothetical protein